MTKSRDIEKVNSYVLKLVYQAEGLSELDKVVFYINGLTPTLQVPLRENPPLTLNAAMDHAVRVVNARTLSGLSPTGRQHRSNSDDSRRVQHQLRSQQSPPSPQMPSRQYDPPPSATFRQHCDDIDHYDDIALQNQLCFNCHAHDHRAVAFQRPPRDRSTPPFYLTLRWR